MTDRSRDRREAEALQKALERHSRLLGEGIGREESRERVAARSGGEAAALFGLAVGLGEAAAPVPAPKFADAFEARLRRSRLGPRSGTARAARPARRQMGWRRWFEFQPKALGLAAAAAAIAIFAGLLVPAFRSLPGDSLYALKKTAESARLAVVSGPREANLRIRLAAERFEEVEQLIERAQLQEVGPGLAAAPFVQDIKDPRLAQLIEETLTDAQEQIEEAAKILIAEPNNLQALDDLVTVSQRGQKLAEEVAEDLPGPIKPPVLSTVVHLAKVEAEAKAARMMVEPPPPPPCDPPTPSPTPTAETSTNEPADTPEATPTPTPTVTPEPTPCVSPEPTPTSQPTPTPTPTPESASASESSSTPPPTQQPQSTSAQGEKSDGTRRWTPQPASSGKPSEA